MHSTNSNISWLNSIDYTDKIIEVGFESSEEIQQGYLVMHIHTNSIWPHSGQLFEDVKLCLFIA